MAERILNVQVRPPRIAVLINKLAGEKDLLLAFQFFSLIWGGRFCQLFPVDPDSCDGLTRFRLDASRPEFIYGINVKDDFWANTVREVCQPRGFGSLQLESLHSIQHQHSVFPEEYYLVDHALLQLFQTRNRQNSQRQNLRLVSPEGSAGWALFCGAMFGIHHRNLLKHLFDEETVFATNTVTAFVELATDFVRQWRQSWLDVTGHELNPHISESGPLGPTIVLVESIVLDLSLFWNLRSASDTIHPAWVIPIPFDRVIEPIVLEKLKEWLLAFLPYGPRPNYCHVTSQTVKEDSCQEFAEQFQATLGGPPIESVVFVPPRNRLPVVVPVEYERTWAVDITGKKLTIQPPKPKAFEQVSSPRSWIVDLIEDVKTGRAVKELVLPHSPVVFELLNAPCPPQFDRSILARTGDGIKSINLRCSGKKEVHNVHLPSGEEILEEILREHGVEPMTDEKRSSYLPVIRRFGGLYLAAKAFSGKSGVILATLEKETKTLSEIKSICKLGEGVVPGESYLDSVDQMLLSSSERIKRIGRKRFAQYARNQSPETLRLASVVEFWADRSILTREWKIGPCAKCHKSFFEPRLNIQRRILCPACGNRIALRETVPLGYALHKTVKLAMNEGIVPVVLAGRFLMRMTHRGFFWLPGVKYKIQDLAGDIDVLACCDGYLVFCECKRLEDTPSGTKVWDTVASQFIETAKIAKRCGGSLVVLAAQVSRFPQELEDRLKDGVGKSIPFLLLNKQDLESGYREVSAGGHRRSLGFFDLIPIPFPETQRQPDGKPRIVEMGGGIYHGS
jgi:DNA-directed RNA polymerase subunit RPC12/RpoP